MLSKAKLRMLGFREKPTATDALPASTSSHLEDRSAYECCPEFFKSGGDIRRLPGVGHKHHEVLSASTGIHSTPISHALGASSREGEHVEGWNTASSQRFIRPRSFNNVMLCAPGVVLKSSKANSIRGELFFYTHLPAAVAHLFPTLLKPLSANRAFRATSPYNGGIRTREEFVCFETQAARCAYYRLESKQEETSVFTTYVEGPTFAHLLTGGCLSAQRVTYLLKILQYLHTMPCEEPRCQRSRGDVDVYENYARKLEIRRNTAPAVYRSVEHVLTPTHLDDLTWLLRDYENGRRGIKAPIIHGDPVFSNVLCDTRDSLKLLDMRGMQGTDRVTLIGDAVYDLAKVLQSLTGYDHVIRNMALRAIDAELLRSLQRAFSSSVKAAYPTVRLRDVALVTASLYASMLPLHETAHHRERFAHIAVAILECVTASIGRGDVDFSFQLIPIRAQ